MPKAPSLKPTAFMLRRSIPVSAAFGRICEQFDVQAAEDGVGQLCRNGFWFWHTRVSALGVRRVEEDTVYHTRCLCSEWIIVSSTDQYKDPIRQLVLSRERYAPYGYR